MQHLSESLNKIASALRSLKHRKMMGRWSFLFVKENGEIISIDRFKELVITLVLVMIIMLAATTSLYFLYKSETGENKRLQKALKTFEDKIAALQDEKDVLIRQLIRSGADRILVHIDIGQRHIHENIDEVRDVLFSRLEKYKINYSLSFTIYKEN